MIPTLATVSLSIDHMSIKARVVRCHEHPPDTKEVDGYGATERLLEPRREFYITLTSRLVQSVCEGDLLRVIFGEQADLHSQWSWYRRIEG